MEAQGRAGSSLTTPKKEKKKKHHSGNKHNLTVKGPLSFFAFVKQGFQLFDVEENAGSTASPASQHLFCQRSNTHPLSSNKALAHNWFLQQAWLCAKQPHNTVTGSEILCAKLKFSKILNTDYTRKNITKQNYE